MFGMKTGVENNSKERLLQAAVKLFAQKGFEATSTREICKLAEVNLCMISYHFGGKQELYSAIIENLITRQTDYAKTFIDLNLDINALTKAEQIELLHKTLGKFIDFFYSNITSDLVVFLIKEQQKPSFVGKSPAFEFLKNLIAAVFNKKPDDKDIIFKTLFIISQINCSRVFPAFSLRPLGQEEFTETDIQLIKNNVKNYINMLLREENIV